MSKKLRVGIAGYGIVGQRRHQVIDGDPLFETVAVCDLRFKESSSIPHPKNVTVYSNYEDLLGEKLDVLFVCLTNDVAAEATIAGLNHGLHVFCEKPPGKCLKDIANVRLVEKKHPNLKLMYGFNHRYHDSIIEAKKLIDSGELGKIINLRGVYGKSKIISYNSTWRSKRAVAGGGILLDQGIHMVDLIRYFAGEFEDIKSFVENSFWNYDVEDNAYALMKSKLGQVAFLHSTATQWRHRFSLDISLERGGIWLSGILSGSKSYGAEMITIAYASGADGGDPKEITTRFNSDLSWKREVQYFSDVISKDLPVEQGSSHDAFKTMELVYRIYCADPEWKARYKLTDRVE